jgi:hypothetical protein
MKSTAGCDIIMTQGRRMLNFYDWLVETGRVSAVPWDRELRELYQRYCDELEKEDKDSQDSTEELYFTNEAMTDER